MFEKICNMAKTPTYSFPIYEIGSYIGGLLVYYVDKTGISSLKRNTMENIP